MAPVKIGASDSTETRMTERRICVFMDISGTVYRSSGFNPCGNVHAQTSRATPRYHEIYLDILEYAWARVSRSCSFAPLVRMDRRPIRDCKNAYNRAVDTSHQ